MQSKYNRKLDDAQAAVDEAERKMSKMEAANKSMGGLAMQASYGAVEPKKDPPAWTQRGSIFSILVAVGGGVISHVVFVISIFSCLRSAQGKIFSCHGKGASLMGDFGLGLCQYLSSYTECFPELTVAVILILAGRNLLQMRLYYTMLERGAVVLFTSRHFFSDVLVRLYLWCYMHIVFHLGFIMYMVLSYGGEAFAEGELEAKAGVEQHKHQAHSDIAAKDFEALSSLTALLLIPATLFVVFLYGTYDIEGSFLPLSQYFHDARQQNEKSSQKWEAEATCKLVMLTDVVAKAIVDERYVRLNEQAAEVENFEDALIRSYQTVGAEMEARKLPPLGLLGSFWPARLLANRKLSGLSQEGFATIWIVFASLSMLICLLLSVSMTLVSIKQVHMTEEHVARKFHILIVAAHIVIEVCLAGSFGQSLLHHLEAS